MFKYRIQAIWPPIVLFVSAASAFPLVPVALQVLLLGFMVLMILDMAGRMKDFDDVVEFLSRARTKQTVSCRLGILMARHRSSWCQREMLKAAADSIVVGGRGTVTAGFHVAGYRWYHFTPDKAFSASSPFLSRRWWRAFFGWRGE